MNKRQYKKYEKKMHEQGRKTLREIQEEREIQKEITKFLMNSDSELAKTLRALSDFMIYM